MNDQVNILLIDDDEELCDEVRDVLPERQRALDEHARNRLVAAVLVDHALGTLAELRFIHLTRHLETPPLLTSDQIARYNDLRGYGADDPCTNIPEGHDPAMWRRHNNCN
jgi:hypothetical protein